MAEKTMVDYTLKIKPYLEGVAPIEPTTTAASAHAVGDKFYLNGTKVKCTTAISVGDTIAIGTNVEQADDVESEIQALTNKLDNEIVTRSELGAKNILPFDLAEIKVLNTNGTWAGNVYTYRGVDFTVNSDGTISATGTATGGNASIKLFAASSNYEMLGKEVILTGCPSNGSASTYRIQAYRMASADGSTGTYFDDGEGTDAFTVLNDASGTVGSFAVAVYENATVTNLLFKPMVRLASDSDDTYEPYAKTNKELTDEVNLQNTAVTNLSGKAYQTDDTAETAIDDADYVPFYDSSVTAKRKSLWSNIKAVLKTYFDTLYATLSSVTDLSTAVANKHKLTIKTVATSGWTADSTSQSGTTLYKKSISLSHVYVAHPSVDIATSTGTGLPTTAQQTAYDLLQYVTVDGTTLYLYASAIPATQFYIGVEGVD